MIPTYSGPARMCRIFSIFFVHVFFASNVALDTPFKRSKVLQEACQRPPMQGSCQPSGAQEPCQLARCKNRAKVWGPPGARIVPTSGLQEPCQCKKRANLADARSVPGKNRANLSIVHARGVPRPGWHAPCRSQTWHAPCRCQKTSVEFSCQL